MTTVLTSKLDTINFESKAEKIKHELSSLVSVDISQITIKRNDTMKVKIDEILSSLENTNYALVIGKGDSIAKLVSIVEIVKKKKDSLKQYNKLSSITEVLKTKSTSDQKDQESALLEAAGHTKVQEKAILSVLLAGEEKLNNRDLEESGWNAQ
ncbi:hypothetical protein CLIB1423_11S01156 [[Candida] railenensis]|uniref:DNA/RNA-binding protein Alba-like domain-containing protein n=1 Tax=[Candida] railenensis TaxID=45579 RepID=A0A9P0VZG1_9ASCO|nr:hypothetical protein CLIB1423_11S01156 [[Candida] railenensis]